MRDFDKLTDLRLMINNVLKGFQDKGYLEIVIWDICPHCYGELYHRSRMFYVCPICNRDYAVIHERSNRLHKLMKWHDDYDNGYDIDDIMLYLYEIEIEGKHI